MTDPLHSLRSGLHPGPDAPPPTHGGALLLGGEDPSPWQLWILVFIDDPEHARHIPPVLNRLRRFVRETTPTSGDRPDLALRQLLAGATDDLPHASLSFGAILLTPHALLGALTGSAAIVAVAGTRTTTLAADPALPVHDLASAPPAEAVLLAHQLDVDALGRRISTTLAHHGPGDAARRLAAGAARAGGPLLVLKAPSTQTGPDTDALRTSQDTHLKPPLLILPAPADPGRTRSLLTGETRPLAPGGRRRETSLNIPAVGTRQLPQPSGSTPAARRDPSATRVDLPSASHPAASIAPSDPAPRRDGQILRLPEASGGEGDAAGSAGEAGSAEEGAGFAGGVAPGFAGHGHAPAGGDSDASGSAGSGSAGTLLLALFVGLVIGGLLFLFLPGGGDPEEAAPAPAAPPVEAPAPPPTSAVSPPLHAADRMPFLRIRPADGMALDVDAHEVLVRQLATLADSDPELFAAVRTANRLYPAEACTAHDPDANPAVPACATPDAAERYCELVQRRLPGLPDWRRVLPVAPLDASPGTYANSTASLPERTPDPSALLGIHDGLPEILAASPGMRARGDQPLLEGTPGQQSPFRVARGLRSTLRNAEGNGNDLPLLGFRCVRDAPSEQPGRELRSPAP